jgi:excisionase family DNA binding protein
VKTCEHCGQPIPLIRLSTAEAAKVAGVSAQTVINWCEAGRFDYSRHGRGPRYIHRDSFIAYLRQGEQKA